LSLAVDGWSIALCIFWISMIWLEKTDMKHGLSTNLVDQSCMKLCPLYDWNWPFILADESFVLISEESELFWR